MGGAGVFFASYPRWLSDIPQALEWFCIFSPTDFDYEVIYIMNPIFIIFAPLFVWWNGRAARRFNTRALSAVPPTPEVDSGSKNFHAAYLLLTV